MCSQRLNFARLIFEVRQPAFIQNGTVAGLSLNLVSGLIIQELVELGIGITGPHAKDDPKDFFRHFTPRLESRAMTLPTPSREKPGDEIRRSSPRLAGKSTRMSSGKMQLKGDAGLKLQIWSKRLNLKEDGFQASFQLLFSARLVAFCFDEFRIVSNGAAIEFGGLIQQLAFGNNISILCGHVAILPRYLLHKTQ